MSGQIDIPLSPPKIGSGGTALSVQQIKFECLAYIKEFDLNSAHWICGAVADPEEAFSALGVDAVTTPWLCKPALTVIAAETVSSFLCGRMRVQPLKDRAATVLQGRYIVLVKHE